MDKEDLGLKIPPPRFERGSISANKDKIKRFILNKYAESSRQGRIISHDEFLDILNELYEKKYKKW